MRNWRIGCGAAALVLALGGCAGDEEPAAIDGRVDIVPADKAADSTTGRPADDAKTVAESGKDGTATGTKPIATTDPRKGKDPTSDQPKAGKQECALAVAASNALINKHVLALFPAKALRQVEPMHPDDTFHCDPAEGPDFGGVSALWRNITGAQAIEILEKDGWTRTDPKEGEPAWAEQGLRHGNGELNLEPAEKYVVTFNTERGGRAMWVELTQDGMRAGLE
ncbi:hypothetical protein [Sporichthya sp.]|uniref:hypothetical protein n=1 Tax=Sporichthya sp. TaxID=65475 RepID=UPI0017FA3541|nr:hypothetical protein [Sporichthya sp.]MBA3741709.1 hypothetical protein [Sporichthya sp.]